MNQTDFPKDEIINLLADLLFAYINKDEAFPHSFEVEAVEKAVALLEKEYKGTQYTREFFQRCKKYVQNKE